MANSVQHVGYKPFTVDLEPKTAVEKSCLGLDEESPVFMCLPMVLQQMPSHLMYWAVFISQNPEGFRVIPSSEIKLGNSFSFPNGGFGLIFKEGL